jgi:hypothetical protein
MRAALAPSVTPPDIFKGGIAYTKLSLRQHMLLCHINAAVVHIFLPDTFPAPGSDGQLCSPTLKTIISQIEAGPFLPFMNGFSASWFSR